MLIVSKAAEEKGHSSGGNPNSGQDRDSRRSHPG